VAAFVLFTSSGARANLHGRDLREIEWRVFRRLIGTFSQDSPHRSRKQQRETDNHGYTQSEDRDQTAKRPRIGA
jgi:hypothetical protein